jgi:hypothetical protein
MKSLLTLFVCALLFSCNSDDDAESTPATDPTLLQKVIFSPGTVSEKHWNFYPNGMLMEIAKPDGTVLESFTYDANNNLLSGNGHTFTYDASNIITTVDGYPVAYGYDAAGGKYSFEFEVPDVEDAGIDFPHKTEVIVNADFLPLSRKIFYNYPEGEIFYTPFTSLYQNGNLKTAAQMDGETYQRREYDNNPNPLKAALLPICRAMGLINANQMYPGLGNWQDGTYCSNNNVIELKFALEDPESNTFEYVSNSIGLPTVQISQAYDFGEPTGSPITSIQYYYQGDVIP